MPQLSASPNLIAFLHALPERRKRRGVRYPQWLLLLMAILGILSGCRSARDLERFAKRHHLAFGAALDLELPKAPCDSTFLYLFERVPHYQQSCPPCLTDPSGGPTMNDEIAL